jgi:hypothetical protein
VNLKALSSLIHLLKRNGLTLREYSINGEAASFSCLPIDNQKSKAAQKAEAPVLEPEKPAAAPEPAPASVVARRKFDFKDAKSVDEFLQARLKGSN